MMLKGLSCRQVFQTFQANGLFLDKEALATLSEYVSSVGGSHDVIMQLIEGHSAGTPPAPLHSNVQAICLLTQD